MEHVDLMVLLVQLVRKVSVDPMVTMAMTVTMVKTVKLVRKANRVFKEYKV
jgi:hypothetical protein